jgi:hypothetical protein
MSKNQNDIKILEMDRIYEMFCTITLQERLQLHPFLIPLTVFLLKCKTSKKDSTNYKKGRVISFSTTDIT